MRLAVAASLVFSTALSWWPYPVAGQDAASVVRGETQKARRSAEAGDAAAAEEHYLNALAALESLMSRERGFQLRHISELRLKLGRLGPARAAAVAALRDAEAAGDAQLAGWVMYDLAGIDLVRGAYESAATFAERASSAAEGIDAYAFSDFHCMRLDRLR